jgi:hypothetical protein
MPKKIHEVNMHAQDFQGPKPNEKRYQVKKDTKWRKHYLEGINKRYIKE